MLVSKLKIRKVNGGNDKYARAQKFICPAPLSEAGRMHRLHSTCAPDLGPARPSMPVQPPCFIKRGAYMKGPLMNPGAAP